CLTLESLSINWSIPISRWRPALTSALEAYLSSSTLPAPQVHPKECQSRHSLSQLSKHVCTTAWIFNPTISLGIGLASAGPTAYIFPALGHLHAAMPASG